MIKDIDRGYKRIKKDALSMKNIEIRVGLFGDGNSPKNNLAYRGVVQELGAKIKITPKMRNFLKTIGIFVSSSTDYIIIPKRPFMRTAFDTKEKQLQRAGLIWYKQLLEGKITLKQFLDKLGVLHTNQIKTTITSFNWKANHPRTIAQKNSSKPLIDSGEMRNSIEHRIVRK